MSSEPNDATDTERTINGVKYVGQDAKLVNGWRASKVPSCEGCEASKQDDEKLCKSLPACRSHSRNDGRNLIFVAETKEDK